MDEVGLGNDGDVEWGRETVPAKEEIPADQDRDDVAQTLGAALVIHGALGEERCQHPDHEEDAPADGDNVLHDVDFSIVGQPRRLPIGISASGALALQIQASAVIDRRYRWVAKPANPIAFNSAASNFASSVVSSTKGGRTLVHSGSFR